MLDRYDLRSKGIEVRGWIKLGSNKRTKSDISRYNTKKEINKYNSLDFKVILNLKIPIYKVVKLSKRSIGDKGAWIPYNK